MRLTKTVADSAKYPAGSGANQHFILWDSEIRGFGLRVYPSGRKAFIFRYRAKGRKRLMTVGEYGPMTVHQARDRARKMRVQVADGDDPREEARRRGEETKRVADLAEGYMREVETTRKPSTVRNYRQLLDAYVLPAVGSFQPAAVTEDDVRHLHRSMKATPYSANRALFLLSKLMTIAEKRGLRGYGTNPCRDVRQYKERARSRYLSTEELARLADALRRLEEQRLVSLHAAAAVRLLLLTGCRVNEVLTLRWEYIDFEATVALLPDSKTGEKVVYLNAPALQVLADIPRTEGNPYVIEGAGEGRHLVNLRKAWYRMRDEAGLEGVRLHDLRHTFGSWGASGGLSLPLIGKLLGHRQAASTERYAHLAADPVREASERVAEAISAAMSGKAGEVVPIATRR